MASAGHSYRIFCTRMSGRCSIRSTARRSIYAGLNALTTIVLNPANRIIAASDPKAFPTGQPLAMELLESLGTDGTLLIDEDKRTARTLDAMTLQGQKVGALGKRHLGFAERAGEGTLFLDEIGELAPSLQAKLLQLLENRQFYRVGGETPVTFKGRLVAATNADLTALIAAKRFRLDLYHRINVVEVKIPPLRERAQDIAWLMNQIFADLVAEQGKSMRGVSALAEQAALAHPWPGNVRELKNRLERAVALNLTGWISPQDLFPEKRPIVTPSSHSSWSLADAREAAEKHQIAATLAENDGQIGKTAETLGVSRTTLWEKMKRYGLAES